MRAEVRLLRRPSYYVYKYMIQDIFQVLTSHPALISSDISQLRLIIISQQINSVAYNNILYVNDFNNNIDVVINIRYTYTEGTGIYEKLNYNYVIMERLGNNSLLVNNKKSTCILLGTRRRM